MESKAIRLTNKTAVALRENAKKTRNAYFIVGAAGTLALLGAAVYFGMQWLPAVPLLLAAAVAMDALMGGVFGLARGVLLLFIFFALVPIIQAVVPVQQLTDVFTASRLAPLFDSQIILSILGA